MKNSTYPRIVASGDLVNLDPFYIAVEGRIYLSFGGKNIKVAAVVAILIATIYILNMEYTPGVSNMYAFLEAVTMDRNTDARKRISVQKLLSELGLHK